MKQWGFIFVIAVAVISAQYIGCLFCIGTPSRGPVTVTTIPNSQVEVLLHGPSKKGEYSAVVSTRNVWTPRDLGRLQPNQTMPARLDDLGDGVFRVRWGDDSSGPYVIIDIKKELVVEDSNKANPKNQPFNIRPS